jgi:serine/threonine protein kinase
MTGTRVGEKFGPYELRSLLGAGGMGEVYQAYDTIKDRMVALKLLRPELAVDPSFQERFRRESRTAARLHEPHIVPVHNFGEIDDVLFIDMRLVEGASLKAVLARSGPMVPARAVAIITQVAAALDAAHASGLTHRDVKPENLLLTPDDFVYLVDFGIAHSGRDSGLTTAGSAIGSCAYMAPERFSGGTVGPPADVYSLACVLFECLTGQPPYPTGDLPSLMSAHLLAPPPRPSITHPGLHPSFDAVILWGMTKDPVNRCPSAGELARAASAAAMSVPAMSVTAAPRPLQTPSPRRHLGRGAVIGIAATVAVLAVAAVGGLWLAFGGNRTTDATPTSATMTRVPITSTRTETVEPTVTTETPPQAISLPGTDALGFMAYPGARCAPGQRPAALGITAASALVVCRYGTDGYYYRGVRLRDGAQIELDHAVPTADGFDVVNQTDGTRYEIRSGALTIITPEGEVFSEPMIQYASS